MASANQLAKGHRWSTMQVIGLTSGLLLVVYFSQVHCDQRHFAASVSSSPSHNDLPFVGHGSSGTFDNSLDQYFQSATNNNDSCSEIWCESNDPNYYDEDEFEDDDQFGDDDHRGTKGFWLDAPPDDILFMPPPPMPPAFQASLFNMENESLKDYIIGEDPEEGFRCNFCKKFADPSLYPNDPILVDVDGDLTYPFKAPSKDNNDSFVSSFYLLIFSIVVLCILALLILIKYKKWKIFPVSESCPILASGVLGHHKSSSGSSSSPSDTRLPVVNEKSPQSIIMDAPLASLGKKSTISTTGKYWKRIPNNVSGNIFSMEDRRGLRSLGGSSTGMSDHPYSDAASCTSSPVYAELDPSVAGSCHTPTLIGPPGTGAGSVVSSSFSPYAFSNTYSEVPDSLRGHPHFGHHLHGMSPSLLTDSSTYDNAAYLPASSQQSFLSGHNSHYNSRSLRRLAAQRSAVINAGGQGQVSTPLLAGHPYHQQPPYHHQAGTMHHSNHHSTPIAGAGQFQFLTGGRPLKKPRPGNGGQQQTSFGYRTGPRNQAMNHYVTQGSDNGMEMMLGDDQQQLTSPQASYGGIGPFASFLDNTSNGSNRKSSNSSQYTEMPLLQQHNTTSSSGFNVAGVSGHGIHYRMPETCSANDLNSAASSSSTGSGGNGGHVTTNSTSSANSSTSLKRPLPPVPGSTGHVRL